MNVEPLDRKANRDDAIGETLGDLARELEELERRRERLYAQRLRVWQRAVRFGWTHARVAVSSRTTEGAVTQALRRARLGRHG